MPPPTRSNNFTYSSTYAGYDHTFTGTWSRPDGTFEEGAEMEFVQSPSDEHPYIENDLTRAIDALPSALEDTERLLQDILSGAFLGLGSGLPLGSFLGVGMAYAGRGPNKGHKRYVLSNGDDAGQLDRHAPTLGERSIAEARAEADISTIRFRSISATEVEGLGSIRIGGQDLNASNIYRSMFADIGTIEREKRNIVSKGSRDAIRTSARNLRAKLTALNVIALERRAEGTSVPNEHIDIAKKVAALWENKNPFWTAPFEELTRSYVSYWWLAVKERSPALLTYDHLAAEAAIMKASFLLPRDDRDAFVFAGRRFLTHLIFSDISTKEAVVDSGKRPLSYSGLHELLGDELFGKVWERYRDLQYKQPDLADPFIMLFSQYIRHSSLAGELDIKGHRLDRNMLVTAINNSRDASLRDNRVISLVRDFFVEQIGAFQPSMDDLKIGVLDRGGVLVRYVEYLPGMTLRDFMSRMPFSVDELSGEFEAGSSKEESVALSSIKEWGIKHSGEERTREPGNLQRLLWVYNVLNRRAEELGLRIDFLDYLASIYPAVGKFISKADAGGNITLEAPSFMFNSPVSEWSLSRWAQEFKVGEMPHGMKDSTLEKHWQEMVRRPRQESIARYIDTLSQVTGSNRDKLENFLVGFLLILPAMRRMAGIFDVSGAMVNRPEPDATRYTISVVPDGVEYESLRSNLPNITRELLREDPLSEAEEYALALKDLGVTSFTDGTTIGEYEEDLEDIRKLYILNRMLISDIGTLASGRTFADIERMESSYSEMKTKMGWLMRRTGVGELNTPSGNIGFSIGNAVPLRESGVVLTRDLVTAFVRSLGAEKAGPALKAAIIIEKLRLDGDISSGEMSSLDVTDRVKPFWDDEAGIDSAIDDIRTVVSSIKGKGFDIFERRSENIGPEIWEHLWESRVDDDGLSVEEKRVGRNVIFSYFIRTRFPSNGFWPLALESELVKAKASPRLKTSVEAFVREISGNEQLPPKSVEEAVERVWFEYVSFFPEPKKGIIPLTEALAFIAERVGITTLGSGLERQNAAIVARIGKMLSEYNSRPKAPATTSVPNEIRSGAGRRDVAQVEELLNDDELGVARWLEASYLRSPLSSQEFKDIAKRYLQGQISFIKALYNARFSPHAALARDIAATVENMVGDYLLTTRSVLKDQYDMVVLMLEDVARGTSIPDSPESLFNEALSLADVNERQLRMLSALLGRDVLEDLRSETMNVFNLIVRPRLDAIAAEEASLDSELLAESAARESERAIDLARLGALDSSIRAFSQMVEGMFSSISAVERSSASPEAVIAMIEEGVRLVDDVERGLPALERDWEEGAGMIDRLGEGNGTMLGEWLDIISGYRVSVASANDRLASVRQGIENGLLEEKRSGLRSEASALEKDIASWVERSEQWGTDMSRIEAEIKALIDVIDGPGFDIEAYKKIKSDYPPLINKMDDLINGAGSSLDKERSTIADAYKDISSRARELGVDITSLEARFEDSGRFNDVSTEINRFLRSDLANVFRRAEDSFIAPFNGAALEISGLPEGPDSISSEGATVTLVDPKEKIGEEIVVRRLRSMKVVVFANESILVNEKDAQRVQRWLGNKREGELKLSSPFGVDIDIQPKLAPVSVRSQEQLPQDHPLRLFIDGLAEASVKDPVVRSFVWKLLNAKDDVPPTIELANIIAENPSIEPANIIRRWLLLRYRGVDQLYPGDDSIYKREFAYAPRVVADEEIKGITAGEFSELFARRHPLVEDESWSFLYKKVWLERVKESLTGQAVKALESKDLSGIFTKLVGAFSKTREGFIKGFEDAIISVGGKGQNVQKISDGEMKQRLLNAAYRFFLENENELAGHFLTTTQARFTWEEQADLARAADTFILSGYDDSGSFVTGFSDVATLQVLKYVFSQPRLVSLAHITKLAAGKKLPEPVLRILRAGYAVQARYFATHGKFLFPMHKLEDLAYAYMNSYHALPEVLVVMDTHELRKGKFSADRDDILEKEVLSLRGIKMVDLGGAYLRYELYSLLIMLKSGDPAMADAAKAYVERMDINDPARVSREVIELYSKYREKILADQRFISEMVQTPYPSEYREFATFDKSLGAEFPELRAITPLIEDHLKEHTYHLGDPNSGLLSSSLTFNSAFVPAFKNLFTVIFYLTQKRLLDIETEMRFGTVLDRWQKEWAENMALGRPFNINLERKVLAKVYREHRQEIIEALKKEENGITHAEILTGSKEPWNNKLLQPTTALIPDAIYLGNPEFRALPDEKVAEVMKELRTASDDIGAGMWMIAEVYPSLQRIIVMDRLIGNVDRLLDVYRDVGRGKVSVSNPAVFNLLMKLNLLVTSMHRRRNSINLMNAENNMPGYAGQRSPFNSVLPWYEFPGDPDITEKENPLFSTGLSSDPRLHTDSHVKEEHPPSASAMRLLKDILKALRMD